MENKQELSTIDTPISSQEEYYAGSYSFAAV